MSMSIEEQINELIIQMENRGYEFESDGCAPSSGPSTVGFVKLDDQTYKTFKDWDAVEKFVNDNPVED